MNKKAIFIIVFTVLLVLIFWWTFGGLILANAAGGIGLGDFWVMNLDGSAVRRLTDSCHVRDPQWSPDNQKLLYTSLTPDSPTGSYGRITWLEIDSPERKRFPVRGILISPRARWSPDGNQIAYVDKDRIYFVDISIGKTLSSVAIGEEGITNHSLSWSPDGLEIVYFSDGESVETGNRLFRSIYQLYAMNIESSESRHLGTGSHSVYQFPTWSPDGNNLALLDYTESGKTVILAMDGSDQEYIWSQNELDISKLFWSRDGTRIAAHQCPAESMDCRTEESLQSYENVIFTINPDGSNRQDLQRGFIELMGWDEDGTGLIYRSIEPGNDRIYKIGSRDSSPELLAEIPMQGQKPILSPNKARVVFQVPYCGLESDISSIEGTIRWRQRGEFVLNHTFGFSDLNVVTNVLTLGFFIIFPFLQTFVTVGLIGWQKFSSKPTSKRFRVLLWISVIITLLLWLLIFILIFILNYLLKDFGYGFLG